jgi:hypothetical protein
VLTSPLKSRRRSRTIVVDESSPSPPATKRQRISTHKSESTSTECLPTRLRPAEHKTRPHRSETKTVAIETPKAIARQVKVPLFLDDDPGSGQQPETDRARHEDEKPFTLDLDAFDIEPSTMITTDLSLEGTTESSAEPANGTVELHPSVCMDKDATLAPDIAQTAGEAELVTELDGYAQGIAEWNAWLYSGAVELTD